MEDTTRLKVLCDVLGLDLKNILRSQVDGSIDNIDKWIQDGLSLEIVNHLASTVEKLSETKSERFIQLKEMASKMVSYWSILSTPLEEKRDFLSLTHYAEVSEADITEYCALSEDTIKSVQDEYDKLEKQMADLISKKSKLEQIFQRSHLKATISDTGTSDSCTTFEQVKSQISEAKVIASQRKDIVTRVELLESAIEEIEWYLNSNVSNQRVSRARILVQVFPKMLRELKDKANLWKLNEADAFHFDGVDVSQIVDKVEGQYKRQVGIGSRDRDDAIDLEVEGVDINQLVVPRKPRTHRLPVQAPVPAFPPPPPQAVPDGDDSMQSDGSRSDPNDPAYDPDDDSGESG